MTHGSAEMREDKPCIGIIDGNLVHLERVCGFNLGCFGERIAV
jgi:hypothetical protein